MKPPLPITFALTVSLALTGCTRQFEIPVWQAPYLATGAVQTVDGEQEKLPDDYSVALIPHQGAVLVRPAATAAPAAAIPKDDLEGARLRGNERVPWIQGPVDARFWGPYLVVSGQRDGVTAPADTIRAIAVKQFSPGRTAGLVTGSILGATALVPVVMVAAVLFSGGFSTGAGMR